LSQSILIKVAPDGSTEVRTEGFAGSACKQASLFIERALGAVSSEQLTQDFYGSSIEAVNNTLQQGESQ